MQSITEAFTTTKKTPYGGKPLTVTVVAAREAVSYRNSSGENRQCLHCAVSDNVEVIKAVVFDPAKFTKFRTRSTLVIRDGITKIEDGMRVLVITQKTKVFMTTHMDIDSDKVSAGVQLLNPPPAPTVTLRDALSSPMKTRCTVSGKVVQEDEMRYVNVKGENVPIKTVHLTDDSASRVKVTLWRELASSDTRPGDFVRITDLIPSTYKSEISLSATSNSTVQKTEAPLLKVERRVMGICVQEGLAELFCEPEEVVAVPAELLQQAFPDFADLETITEDGPKVLIIEQKGADIISITHAMQ